MLSGEAANTNFIAFDLTRPEFESTIYRTRNEQQIHPRCGSIKLYRLANIINDSDYQVQIKS